MSVGDLMLRAENVPHSMSPGLCFFVGESKDHNLLWRWNLGIPSSREMVESAIFVCRAHIHHIAIVSTVKGIAIAASSQARAET